MAFECPITHYARRSLFGGETGRGDICVGSYDWSAAAFVMTLAAYPGGPALVTLTNSAAGTEGISSTWDAAYAHPDTGVVIGATTIRPQINEATLEALPAAASPFDPLVLFYDLLVTPSGAAQRAICFGTFRLYQGVGD